ncbi:hypothetical protein ACGFX8_02530 [Streptomyces sp. NPDC048362]|uniref:hypothetical protein n=1 Tax=Streptomyces sp. NPDC048362 TaxID=3365539 RepID=UPI0037193CD9
MRAIRMKMATVLLGAAAAGLAVPAQSFAGTGTDAGPAPKAAYCGADQASGLAVWGTGKVPCATALQAAAAYTKASRDKADGVGEVRAAGVTWKCAERQGDPNPYAECVDAGDPGRVVVLSS